MSIDTERFPWKTPEGRARYLAAYATTLALWPVPYEEHDVPTRFGTTHVVACGPKEAPPVVLLHAMGYSATSWFPNVGELSRDFRVYAVDRLGDINKSVPRHPLRSRAECAQWVVEVFDALHLAQADVVGESFGGWFAFNAALAAPERVRRLVLLNPAAAFVPVSMRFYTKTFPAVFWPIPPLLHRAASAFFVKGFVVNQRFAEQFMLGLTYWHPARLLPLPTVFTEAETRHRISHFLIMKLQSVFPSVAWTEAEVQRLSTPTLLLLGEQDRAMNELAALKRAKELIPHLEAELISKAGHIISMEQPEIVDARILHFLGQGRDTQAAPGSVESGMAGGSLPLAQQA